MLDTRYRKYLDKYFDKTADLLIRRHITPTQVTGIALAFGVSAGALYYFDLILPAVCSPVVFRLFGCCGRCPGKKDEGHDENRDFAGYYL